MKKLFALLLCLSLLLLPGCQTVPIAPPTGSEEDYYKWNTFQWNCTQEVAGSVALSRASEDGTINEATVAYDGEKYTITDSAGTRTYTYLRSFSHAEKTDSGYLYGDYFFLTDDPNMTFEKYQKAVSSPLQDHMELLLPTELVLGKTGVAEDVVCFGDAPKEIETILSQQLDSSAVYYGENSFFTVVLSGSGRMTYLLNRHDYKGNRLCSVEIPLPLVISITELENGGFCAFLSDDSPNNENSLIRYDAEGKLIWQFDFQANRDVDLTYLFQNGDGLYCFGTVDTDVTMDTSDDLYFAKFSMDGTLLKEKIAGGSDFESLKHVVVSGNAFTVYAETQSKDGDFPFSGDGYFTGFKVQLSDELELSGAEAYPESEYVFRHYGFHNGVPIYDGDRIMEQVEADQLPEDVYNEAIFAFGDGYVILRRHRLEHYLFTPPQMSAQLYYVQVIATYYDASGTPIWQTVSEPYLGG